MVRYAPQALFIGTQWVAGLHSKWPAAGSNLKRRKGHRFPILSKIHHRKAILAYSARFRDSFDPELKIIGLATKALAGLMFAKSVDNQTLVDESWHLALLHAEREDIPILVSTLDEIAKIAKEDKPNTNTAIIRYW